MRFDWYTATIADDSRRVVETLSKLGHRLEPCHNLAKAYHYHQGYRVQHNSTGAACTVFLKDDQRPHAFASSDATDAFVDLVRSEWPDRHQVTRMDSCEDFYDAKARRKLTALMRRTAKARRMSLRVIHDPLDPTAGQTTYLGSRKSDFMMRTYDKGWEQYGKLQAQLGRKGVHLPTDIIIRIRENQEIRPADWVRSELQARPQGEEARTLAATCTPEQAWGFTDWSHDVARQAFALELERAYIRARKVSTDDAALQWMLRQYLGPLSRLRDDLGDWACVGLDIGERIRKMQADSR